MGHRIDMDCLIKIISDDFPNAGRRQYSRGASLDMAVRGRSYPFCVCKYNLH